MEKKQFDFGPEKNRWIYEPFFKSMIESEKAHAFRCDVLSRAEKEFQSFRNYYERSLVEKQWFCDRQIERINRTPVTVPPLFKIFGFVNVPVFIYCLIRLYFLGFRLSDILNGSALLFTFPIVSNMLIGLSSGLCVIFMFILGPILTKEWIKRKKEYNARLIEDLKNGCGEKDSKYYRELKENHLVRLRKIGIPEGMTEKDLARITYLIDRKYYAEGTPDDWMITDNMRAVESVNRERERKRSLAYYTDDSDSSYFDFMMEDDEEEIEETEDQDEKIKPFNNSYFDDEDEDDNNNENENDNRMEYYRQREKEWDEYNEEMDFYDDLDAIEDLMTDLLDW